MLIVSADIWRTSARPPRPARRAGRTEAAVPGGRWFGETPSSRPSPPPRRPVRGPRGRAATVAEPWLWRASGVRCRRARAAALTLGFGGRWRSFTGRNEPSNHPRRTAEARRHEGRCRRATGGRAGARTTRPPFRRRVGPRAVVPVSSWTRATSGGPPGNQLGRRAPRVEQHRADIAAAFRALAVAERTELH